MSRQCPNSCPINAPLAYCIFFRAFVNRPRRECSYIQGIVSAQIFPLGRWTKKQQKNIIREWGICGTRIWTPMGHKWGTHQFILSRLGLIKTPEPAHYSLNTITSLRATCAARLYGGHVAGHVALVSLVRAYVLWRRWIVLPLHNSWHQPCEAGGA